MVQSNGRIVVVVVHGMGNQFPMDTLRGFVDALKPEHAVMYSSPNRITEDKETRRLSFNTGPYDFFEYYWAHHVDEPRIGAIVKWSINLLFIKPPSASLLLHIGFIRRAILSLLFFVVALVVTALIFFDGVDTSLVAATLYGTMLFLLIRVGVALLANTVIGSINSSIGDVIKYTVPSPENIAAREKIRSAGIELLKKLHESKSGDKNKYHRVVVVGHSLGSIVAYDMLTSLFAQYHRSFTAIPGGQLQPALAALRESFNNPTLSIVDYQALQANLFDEYRALGFEWRVSNFITMGSSLTHASSIMARSSDDFDSKKKERVFPTCLPQLDQEDNHFAFSVPYKSVAGNALNIQCCHHAAHFAITQWTNIFFVNDWIGGRLAGEFGPGILDIELTACDKLTARIPLASHTKYWDKTEQASITEFQSILTTIQPL